MTLISLHTAYEAAIAASDLAATAAEWPEAKRQLRAALGILDALEVLYPEGAEFSVPGLPAQAAADGAGCEPGRRDPIDDFCAPAPTPPTASVPSSPLPPDGGAGVGGASHHTTTPPA